MEQNQNNQQQDNPLTNSYMTDPKSMMSVEGQKELMEHRMKYMRQYMGITFKYTFGGLAVLFIAMGIFFHFMNKKMKTDQENRMKIIQIEQEERTLKLQQESDQRSNALKNQ